MVVLETRNFFVIFYISLVSVSYESGFFRKSFKSLFILNLACM